MSLSQYLRLAALGDTQRVDDLADRMAHRVSRDIDSAMQGTLRRVVEEAADRMADRLINALAEGLGIAVAAVAGRPVDEGLVDRLADEMHTAYEYEDDGDAGDAGETDERPS
jgi:hypothetical protein